MLGVQIMVLSETALYSLTLLKHLFKNCGVLAYQIKKTNFLLRRGLKSNKAATDTLGNGLHKAHTIDISSCVIWGKALHLFLEGNM